MTHCLWVSLLILVSVTLDNSVLLCKAWIQYSGQILIYSKANQSKVVKTGLNSAKNDRKMNTGSNKKQYFSNEIWKQVALHLMMVEPLHDGQETRLPVGCCSTVVNMWLLLHNPRRLPTSTYQFYIPGRERTEEQKHMLSLLFFFWCVGGS